MPLLTFSKLLKNLKKAGIGVELNSSKEGQKAVIYGNKIGKYGLAILNNEKYLIFLEIKQKSKKW